MSVCLQEELVQFIWSVQEESLRSVLQMDLPLLSRALHVVWKLLVHTIYKNMKARQASIWEGVSIEIRVSLAQLRACISLRGIQKRQTYTNSSGHENPTFYEIQYCMLQKYGSVLLFTSKKIQRNKERGFTDRTSALQLLRCVNCVTWFVRSPSDLPLASGRSETGIVPGNRLSWLEVYVPFTFLSGKIPWLCFKIGHDCYPSRSSHSHPTTSHLTGSEVYRASWNNRINKEGSSSTAGIYKYFKLKSSKIEIFLSQGLTFCKARL
jgi:hypothetical protein